MNGLTEQITFLGLGATLAMMALEYMIGHMDKIGLRNAAMFLYREPIPWAYDDDKALPETMQLRCVLRDGELFTRPS